MDSGSGLGPLPWVGNWRIKQTQVSITLGDTLLVPASGYRVAINFAATLSGGSVWLNSGAIAQTGLGFFIQATGDRSFLYSQWGGLVQQDWHVIASGPGSSIWVTEVLWVPTGDSA